MVLDPCPYYLTTNLSALTILTTLPPTTGSQNCGNSYPKYFCPSHPQQWRQIQNISSMSMWYLLAFSLLLFFLPSPSLRSIETITLWVLGMIADNKNCYYHPYDPEWLPIPLQVESSHLSWPSKADMTDDLQPRMPHTLSSFPISIPTQLSESISPLLQTSLALGKPTSDSFRMENSTSSVFLLLTSAQMQPSWKMIPDHPTKSCF